MKGTSTSYLRFVRYFLLIWVVGAGINLAASFYDSGYVTAYSYFKPADTMELQLNRNKPYRGLFGDLVLAFRNGWNQEQWENRGVSRPVFFNSDSVAAPLGPTGFALLASRNYQVLRYQEPALRNRLFLLWLGASASTTSVVKAGIVFSMLLLLCQMIRDLSAATPFTLANARRLKVLVLLALGWEMWQGLAHLLLYYVMPPFLDQADALARYVVLNGDGQTPGALGITLVAVVTIVYRHGVQLQQEAELTV